MSISSNRTEALRQLFTPVLAVLSETHRRGFDELCSFASLGEASSAALRDIQGLLRRLESSLHSAEVGRNRKGPQVKANVRGERPDRISGKARGAHGKSLNAVPLRDMILPILRESKVPLRVRELSERVLKAGYQTQSKKFGKVLSSLLVTMPEVERGPDGGYRLKS
ncbi:hypothetical protein [Pajaroellobacter abortibovis]|uniref:HTH HARE-type domain-containing protein n=1 Tax=Pajaroellobacter abortibovis TaxID=1882918 RepID=A0A1L6MVY2_9BACT|nr:hypothetical protein [Pajaroellobacter abortibovis]APR99587.1 hypothetical protein BCY86_02005 [Pajaroellobacter abortibovis]